jgi:hypothetical protein
MFQFRPAAGGRGADHWFVMFSVYKARGSAMAGLCTDIPREATL